MPQKLAGIIALSTYLPLDGSTAEPSARRQREHCRSSWRTAASIRSCRRCSADEPRCAGEARLRRSNGTAIRWRIRSVRRKSPICARGSASASRQRRRASKRHTVGLGPPTPRGPRPTRAADDEGMREATPRRWLPQFCSLPTLFAVMVVAELVALIVVLAPDQHGGRGCRGSASRRSTCNGSRCSTRSCCARCASRSNACRRARVSCMRLAAQRRGDRARPARWSRRWIRRWVSA